MKENVLIILCIISIFAGIILMFSVNRFFEPKITEIKDITEDMNYVKIFGKITKITTSKSGTTFLKIKDATGSIDVVVFKNSIKGISEIKTGNKVEIIGKVDKYKEKIEIIAGQIIR